MLWQKKYLWMESGYQSDEKWPLFRCRCSRLAAVLRWSLWARTRRGERQSAAEPRPALASLRLFSSRSVFKVLFQRGSFSSTSWGLLLRTKELKKLSTRLSAPLLIRVGVQSTFSTRFIFTQLRSMFKDIRIYKVKHSSGAFVLKAVEVCLSVQVLKQQYC